MLLVTGFVTQNCLLAIFSLAMKVHSSFFTNKILPLVSCVQSSLCECRHKELASHFHRVQYWL